MKNLFLFFVILGHLLWTGNIKSFEMNRLPSYVQAKIFNELPYEDLLNMRLMNQKCKEIVDNKILCNLKLNVKVEKEKVIYSDLMREITESLEITTSTLGGMNAKWIKKHFPANGKCWTSLKTLILKSNKINNEGAKAIADFLISNPTVTCVDLSYNWIGKKGVCHLAHMLEKNETLISMNLYGDSFDCNYTHIFDEALKKNKALANLNLRFVIPPPSYGTAFMELERPNFDPRITFDKPKKALNDCERKSKKKFCIIF